MQVFNSRYVANLGEALEIFITCEIVDYCAENLTYLCPWDGYVLQD